jgi:hypothetical protein
VAALVVHVIFLARRWLLSSDGVNILLMLALRLKPGQGLAVV